MYGDERKEIFGGEQETTNNRVELIAAIFALASLKRSCDLTLYTDSKYVMSGSKVGKPKGGKPLRKSRLRMSICGSSSIKRLKDTLSSGFGLRAMQATRVMKPRISLLIGALTMLLA